MKYEIGSKIRYYRELRGLNQKELAKRIGVSNGRISNWEQGINRPDADILVLLCQALEVSADELLDLKTTSMQLSATECELIRMYREKPELQSAVNILLGVNVNMEELK